MVGGPREAFERARPVLAAMTATQIYLGASGSGATMKLAYNAMIALANEAISEALVLIERAGIAPADAYSVLAAGALSSPFLKSLFPSFGWFLLVALLTGLWYWRWG